MKSRIGRLALLALGIASATACSRTRDASADGDVAQQSDDELDRAIAADPVLRQAVKDIDAGHPWKATVALAPKLTGAGKKPAAVLIAARAAARWGGWTEVERLLANEPWIDSSFNGEPRELLARAALDRGSNDDAARNATASLTRVPSGTTRAARQVYLARAMDRAEQADSAAQLYRKAADDLPGVADWLLLRAAGSDRDEAQRTAMYGRIKGSVARTRVPWTEAQARERFGDIPGAIERFAALKARFMTLRLRFTSASDGSAKEAAKDSLIAFLRSNPARDEARQAVQLLDAGSVALSPQDELTVARALSGSGPLPRTITGYERADRAALLTPDDRLQWALVLSRSNRNRDALAMLDSIRAPAGVAARAAYQRARIVMTATGASAAIPVLRSVADRFPGDTENASAALYLLADLTSDAGNDDAAAATYRELYRRFPSASRADDARFRAAVLDLVHGRSKPAATAFDSLVTLFPNSNERTAARYWSARAWSAAGDRKKANATLKSIASDQPTSYYGIVSARQLKQPTWKPARTADTFIAVPSVDSALGRVDLLERLGMDVEAKFELDAIEAAAAQGATTDVALATANALRAHGNGSRAIRIGMRLIDQGSSDARAYRLAYPVIDRPELERRAKQNNLSPALVAGLIRQESAFDPRATSVANARGLMQVLPSVGADIARSLRYPVWNASLLYDPDVNLEIGTLHLAAATKQYEDLVKALAAYNAGGARVERWSKKATTNDPELFAEQIPFVETRDYVRIVQRNREMYSALYGL